MSIAEPLNVKQRLTFNGINVVTEQMKKARRQMQERLSSRLAELNQIKPTKLLREDVLGRNLSFRAALAYFDRTLELFHQVSRRDLSQAAFADLANMTDDAARALDHFHKILSFKGEGVDPIA